MKTKLLLLISVLFFALAAVQSKAQDKLQKGIDLFDNQKYEEAKNFFEKIVDEDEKNDRAQFYLGRCYYALKDFGEASDCFEEAVDLKEKNADYHYWLGNAYGQDARTSNFFSQALLAPKIKTQYLKTVELDQNHAAGRTALAQYYLQAPGIMGGSVDKAYEQANILIKQDEKNGRFLLASIYSQQKKLKEAEDEFKILESKFGNDREFYAFYNIYGYFLLNQKRNDEAIAKFRKQVELAPVDANAHDSFGEALMSAGKYEEAAAEFRTALKLNPDFKASKENLKKAEENLKKKSSK